MRHSEHYNLRLPERAEGRNDPADIDDLSYDLESLDGALHAQAVETARLEREKLAVATFALHSGDSVCHLTAAERARWDSVTGKVERDNVLPLDNTIPYSPVGDYHPVTKKYLDDRIVQMGGGDMQCAIYDTDGDGVVDSAAAVPWAGITQKPESYPPAGHQHTEATTAAAGFFSAADKAKLNGVAVSANNYQHPNDAATRHVTDAEKAAWNGKAAASHSQAAGTITAGTLPVGVVATSSTDYGTARLRNCHFATAAPSSLASGAVCFVYE